MKLRLTDGTIIDASMLNGTSTSSSRRKENAPSKRQVKNGGGALKRWHARTSNRNVGGTANTTRAIYDSHNFVTNEATGEVVLDKSSPRPTCVVRHNTPANVKMFTWNLGGSTPSPYRGGKGL